MDPKTNYLANVLGDNSEARMALREIRHLRQCSTELQELIFTYGRIFSLGEGEVLTREGDFDQWVFFIISGRLGVYVGDELVDTISSSLVGERCILGEERKATLKATDEGMTALGVDMALLDVLKKDDASSHGNTAVYVELMSLIAGEIANRIVELEFNRIDIDTKYRAYIRSDYISNIIEGLKNNAYRDDRRVNMEIYKFLSRNGKGMLYRGVTNDPANVDTRSIYAQCVSENQLGLIAGLADTICLYREGQPDFSITEPPAEEHGEAVGFHEFVGHIAALIAVQYATTAQGRAAPRPMSEDGWRRHFKLGAQVETDLGAVCDWLRAEYGFTDLEVIESMMIVLREASHFVARTNGLNKRMMAELSQIQFVQNLGDAMETLELDALDYFQTMTTEEMIPYFSKHVLDVHLVQPYLEELAKGAPDGAGDGTGEPEETVDQSSVDALFD